MFTLFQYLDKIELLLIKNVDLIIRLNAIDYFCQGIINHKQQSILPEDCMNSLAKLAVTEAFVQLKEIDVNDEHIANIYNVGLPLLDGLINNLEKMAILASLLTMIVIAIKNPTQNQAKIKELVDQHLRDELKPFCECLKNNFPNLVNDPPIISIQPPR